ncbi:hypothetical protein J1N35_010836 [Gossypium stocksii]|uniref:Uncharacterized protein n=1 Tax=Gossypium stocksii TaxID=47602 RepID=A0A9D4ACQ2_9ROSI|nr:hypothetical protein J1N35_010836 [Gossypium stocksii]
MGYSNAISSIVEKHVILPFTSLIISLCQRVKVPIQTNEDTIPNKGDITKQLAIRFSGEEMPRYLGSTSTSSPPLPTNTAPSTSHSNFEKKVIDGLEMLQQQFNILEKHQQRLAFYFGCAQEEIAIFWGPIPPFFNFPKELLLEPEEEDDDGEEPIPEKQRKLNLSNFESKKEDDDVTQATTPISTTTDV